MSWNKVSAQKWGNTNKIFLFFKSFQLFSFIPAKVNWQVMATLPCSRFLPRFEHERLKSHKKTFFFFLSFQAEMERSRRTKRRKIAHDDSAENETLEDPVFHDCAEHVESNAVNENPTDIFTTLWTLTYLYLMVIIRNGVSDYCVLQIILICVLALQNDDAASETPDDTNGLAICIFCPQKGLHSPLDARTRMSTYHKCDVRGGGLTIIFKFRIWLRQNWRLYIWI